MDKTTLKSLIDKTHKARQLIIKTIIESGAGHPGGALSCIDVMTALYFHTMNIDSQNPMWDDRDRFILSKGHSSIALYTLLHMLGFIDGETLSTFRKDNSDLGGHLDMLKVPGVEMSTGSLGHGLSVGVGRALAAKIDGKAHRIFVMMGDGETQEGSIWEAAMSASHYKLDNLIGIVDRNKIQIDGFTEDIMTLEPYSDKWESFGWNVKEIDGHNMEEILEVFSTIANQSGKPTMIISHTVKGKGVSYMENTAKWHGGAPSGDLAERALADLLIHFEEKGQ